jgi:hypothetical protein
LRATYHGLAAAFALSAHADALALAQRVEGQSDMLADAMTVVVDDGTRTRRQSTG